MKESEVWRNRARCLEGPAYGDGWGPWLCNFVKNRAPAELRSRMSKRLALFRPWEETPPGAISWWDLMDARIIACGLLAAMAEDDERKAAKRKGRTP